MKLLFIGDIVGKAGRQKLKETLPYLKQEYQYDTLVVNGENAAHGKGITPKIYQEFVKENIDVITLGNHAFSKRIILDELDSCDRLIRPSNMHPENIGKSYKIIQTIEGSLAVINLIGEVFMNNVSISPFERFREILKNIKADMIFVDFHGEATAEKLTFLHTFKKQCVGIVGTHTHIQTADETIIEGCGYITDVGMTGVTHSILGRDIEEVLLANSGEPTHYKVASGPAHLSGVLLEIKDKQCVAIERIQIF